jgi:hypothetical protein
MPVHIENLGRRTQVLFGGTVAVKTPFHAERLSLMDDIHLIDRTVTAITAHATVHMHRVVKIGIIRKAMHPNPRNRLSSLPTLSHKSKSRAVVTNLSIAVAIDTSLRSREIGMPSHLDEAMAVTAIHPKLLDMEGVGKWHRLIRLIADTGVFRREIIPDA